VPVALVGGCSIPAYAHRQSNAGARVTVPPPATVAKAQMISLLGSEAPCRAFKINSSVLLRAYRTIHFCDACLALKIGAFPRDVREAVALIGDGFQISSGKFSECLQAQTVVRALAA
jgi:hypothetical protein